MALIEEAGRIHRLTVEDYVQLATPGDPRWDHTELIEGVVYDVSPEYELHSRTCMHLALVLASGLPNLEVRIGASVVLGPDTMVQPDVFAFEGEVPADGPVDGSRLLLAAEVSVSTKAFDRGAKLRLYAAAGIPRYWVVDPEARSLWRHTAPSATAYDRIERLDLPDDLRTLDGRALFG